MKRAKRIAETNLGEAWKRVLRSPDPPNLMAIQAKNASELRIVAKLIDALCDGKPGTLFFMGTKRLGKDMGVSFQTAHNWLKQLQAMGIIVKVFRGCNAEHDYFGKPYPNESRKRTASEYVYQGLPRLEIGQHCPLNQCIITRPVQVEIRNGDSTRTAGEERRGDEPMSGTDWLAGFVDPEPDDFKRVAADMIRQTLNGARRESVDVRDPRLSLIAEGLQAAFEARDFSKVQYGCERLRLAILEIADAERKAVYERRESRAVKQFLAAHGFNSVSEACQRADLYELWAVWIGKQGRTVRAESAFYERFWELAQKESERNAA